jgi:rhodanese-related sulfurtransferase
VRPLGTRWSALAVLVMQLWLPGRAAARESWPALLARIRAQFPSVPQLGVEAFHADPGERALIVDVREPAEYAVSHLAGARQTQRVEDVRKWLAHGSYRRVVVYCSVGYRSSRFVEQLQRAGISNAVNLEGSIFAWVNAGYPVVNAAGPTPLVHPFDAKWGELLDPKHRAPVR